MKYLVIIDMQNDFITGALGTPEAIIARDNLIEKLNAIEQDTTVIFTLDTHNTNYLETREGRQLPVEHCIIYTDGWHIDNEIKKASEKLPGGHFIFKSTFGSCDDLPGLIRTYEKGKEESDIEIEICGVCTDICVISNALIIRSSFPEARIMVDSSCCAGTTIGNHLSAIQVMKSCQIEVE